MDALLDGKINEEDKKKAKMFVLSILTDPRIEIGENEETKLLKEIYQDYLYYFTAWYAYETIGDDMWHKANTYEYSYKEKIEKLNKILKGKGE